MVLVGRIHFMKHVKYVCGNAGDDHVFIPSHSSSALVREESALINDSL